MPHLSLALALALAAGLAGGVLVDTALAAAASIVLAIAWLTALAGFVRSWPRVQLTGVLLAMVAAGCLFGAHALDRALHPPLRTTLDQRVAARAEEPILIEGRLMEDA